MQCEWVFRVKKKKKKQFDERHTWSAQRILEVQWSWGGSEFLFCSLFFYLLVSFSCAFFLFLFSRDASQNERKKGVKTNSGQTAWCLRLARSRVFDLPFQQCRCAGILQGISPITLYIGPASRDTRVSTETAKLMKLFVVCTLTHTHAHQHFFFTI